MTVGVTMRVSVGIALTQLCNGKLLVVCKLIELLSLLFYGVYNVGMPLLVSNCATLVPPIILNALF